MDQPILVYGTQYYRSPTPESSSWDADLKGIRKCHMNTIKLYIMWAWHNRAENRYDFSDVRTICERAGKQCLWVVANIILCTPPAWIFRKYPDAFCITADGRKLGPLRPGGYQAGGMPGMCYHHPAYRKEAARYLGKLVGTLRGFSNLLVWDVWNEPAFNYASGSLRVEDLTCYCPHSVRAFRKHLASKYESIAGLNEAWQTAYADWDDVQPPRSCDTYGDMIDWRKFAMLSMVEEQRWRCEQVRKLSRRHRVMCHTTATSPFGNPIQRANDDWLLSEPGDLVGASGGMCEFDYPPKSVARAQGKDFWISEFPYTPGGTFARPVQDGLRSWLKEVFATTYMFGARGLMYWQYRPERLGSESPGYGVVDTDGGDAPWTQNVRDVGRVLEQYDRELVSLAPVEPEVGIIYSPEAMIFMWAALGNLDIARNEYYGFTHALMANNVPFDFVHVDYLKEQAHRYKVLYLPLANWISVDTHRRLLSFVEKGGTLFSGPFYGQFDTRNNLHALRTPGYGADEVFGFVEKTVYTNPASSCFVAIPQGILVADPRHGRFQPPLLVEIFKPRRRQVAGLLDYSGRSCAVTRKLGKGSVYFYGVYLGSLFEKEHAIEGGFLRAVVPQSHAVRHILNPIREQSCARDFNAQPYGMITHSLRGRSGINWVAIINKTGKPATATIDVSATGARTAREVFDDHRQSIVRGQLKARLGKDETKVFRIVS